MNTEREALERSKSEEPDSKLVPFSSASVLNPSNGVREQVRGLLKPQTEPQGLETFITVVPIEKVGGKDRGLSTKLHVDAEKEVKKRRLKFVIVRHGDDGRLPGAFDDPAEPKGNSLTQEATAKLNGVGAVLNTFHVDSVYYSDRRQRVKDTTKNLFRGRSDVELTNLPSLLTAPLKVPEEDWMNRNEREHTRDVNLREQVDIFVRDIMKGTIGDKVIFIVTSHTNIKYLIEALLNFTALDTYANGTMTVGQLSHAQATELDFEGLDLADSQNDLVIQLKEAKKIQTIAIELGIPIEVGRKIDTLALEKSIKAHFRVMKKARLNRLQKLLDCQQPDLQAFALRRLIAAQKNEILRAFIHDLKEKKGGVPLHILEIFLRNKDRSQLWRDVLLLSLVTANDVHVIKCLCEKLGLIEEYYRFYQFSLVVRRSNLHCDAVFENSLDVLVRNRKNLLQQNFFNCRQIEGEHIKQKTSWNDHFRRSSVLEDTLLDSPVPVVLLDDVGQGKSIEMAKMKESAENSKRFNGYFPLFYTAASVRSDRDLDCEIRQAQTCLPHKNVIVIFDGIDEIPFRERASIKRYLFCRDNSSSLETAAIKKCKVLMASRTTEFSTCKDARYTSLHFKSLWGSFDLQDFITDRLYGLLGKDYIREQTITFEGTGEEREMFYEKMESDCGVTPKKYAVIQFLYDSGVLDREVGFTPLVIYFLCELVCDDEDALDKIQNRADIYEKIVAKLYLRHQERKQTDHPKNTETRHSKYLDKVFGYEEFIELLSYCAYEMTKEKLEAKQAEAHTEESANTIPTVEDKLHLKIREGLKKKLAKYIESGAIKKDEVDSVLDSLEKEIQTCLSLLLCGEGKGLKFILNSFLEYFTALYLAKDPTMVEKASQEGKYKRFTNGDAFTLALRDNREIPDHWDIWVDFRSVVLFYIQILANTGSEEDLERLKNFFPGPFYKYDGDFGFVIYALTTIKERDPVFQKKLEGDEKLASILEFGLPYL